MKKFMATMLALALLLSGVAVPSSDDHARFAAPTARSESVQEALGRNIVLLADQSKGASMTLGDGTLIEGDLTEGMRLQPGDAVVSGILGSIFFKVDEDKLFELEAESAIVITEAATESLLLTLTRGGMYFYIKKPLNENETLQMTAGTTVMSVRGTNGYISFIEDEVRIVINEGKVDVEIAKPDGTNVEVEVPASTQLFVNIVNPYDPTNPLYYEEGVLLESIPQQNITDQQNHLQNMLGGFLCPCEDGVHGKRNCGHFECQTPAADHAPCALCGGLICSGSHGKNKCVVDCEYCGTKNISGANKSKHSASRCAFDCDMCGKKNIPNRNKSKHNEANCTFHCEHCENKHAKKANLSKHGAGKCAFSCKGCGKKKIPIRFKAEHLKDCFYTCRRCGATDLPIKDKRAHARVCPGKKELASLWRQNHLGLRERD